MGLAMSKTTNIRQATDESAWRDGRIIENNGNVLKTCFTTGKNGKAKNNIKIEHQTGDVKSRFRVTGVFARMVVRVR